MTTEVSLKQEKIYDAIYDLCERNDMAMIESICVDTGYPKQSVNKTITELVSKGLVVAEGSEKTGYTEMNPIGNNGFILSYGEWG